MFGIDPPTTRDAVRSLAPGKMRGERLARNGIEIINDCYNSNPDAVRGMLEVLRDIPAQAANRRAGRDARTRTLVRAFAPGGRSLFCPVRGITVLVGIRGDARFLVESAVAAGLSSDAAFFFEDPEQAGLHLRSIAQEGDAILFKGSRGTRVEKALERFLE